MFPVFLYPINKMLICKRDFIFNEFYTGSVSCGFLWGSLTWHFCWKNSHRTYGHCSSAPPPPPSPNFHLILKKKKIVFANIWSNIKQWWISFYGPYVKCEILLKKLEFLVEHSEAFLVEKSEYIRLWIFFSNFHIKYSPNY